MKKLSLTLLLMLACLSSTFAAKIAWVYSTSNDDTYISLLQGKGHTVDAVSGYWDDLTADKQQELEAYDIIIISRNIGASGSYGTDADVRARWQAISKPIINLNAYVARSSRLELFNNDASSVTDTYMTSTDISHAIFDGLKLSNDTISDEWGNKMSYVGCNVTYSQNAGNGTVLARIPSGEVAIAIWDANAAAYTDAGIQAGKRMFLSMASGDAQSDRWKKVLTNAVEFYDSIPTAIGNAPVVSIATFPNPTNSHITVSGVSTLHGAIYSVTGQKVMNLNQTNNTIDVSALAAGVYFINTEVDNTKQSIRFIKE